MASSSDIAKFNCHMALPARIALTKLPRLPHATRNALRATSTASRCRETTLTPFSKVQVEKFKES